MFGAFAEVPAIVIACHEGPRLAGVAGVAAGGNVMPAMWSFMLAARARGLGTALTTLHLMKEQAVAELLGIPFDTVQQACMTPLAYTIGVDERLNAVIVAGPADKLARAREILAQIDKGGGFIKELAPPYMRRVELPGGNAVFGGTNSSTPLPSSSRKSPVQPWPRVLPVH